MTASIIPIRIPPKEPSYTVNVYPDGFELAVDSVVIPGVISVEYNRAGKTVVLAEGTQIPDEAACAFARTRTSVTYLRS